MESLYEDVPNSDETRNESDAEDTMDVPDREDPNNREDTNNMPGREEIKDVPDMEHSETVAVNEKTNNAGSEDQKTTTKKWFYPTSFNATNNEIPNKPTTIDKGKFY